MAEENTRPNPPVSEPSNVPETPKTSTANSTAPTTAAPNSPRELHDHKANGGFNHSLRVLALDAPGPGGANHEYEIDQVGGAPNSGGVKTLIKFQKGPIAEAGVNGVSNEALIAIVLDRIRGFQGGQFATEDNAQAQEYLEQALNCLHRRTNDRLARGVEGHNKA